MHDSPLVHTATREIHEHGNHGDDAKHAAGAQCLRLLMHAAARRRRAAFEEVRAVVHGGDEGDCGFGEGVRVAEEGDDCGFAAFVVFAFGGFLGGLVVVVVIVAVDDFAGRVGERDGGAAGSGGRGGAERAACVVKNELAAAEDGL